MYQRRMPVTKRRAVRPRAPHAGVKQYVAVLSVATLVLAGCALIGHRCSSGAGGRCGGPEPIREALFGQWTVDAGGRQVSGHFQCGGKLEAKETRTAVRLTYVASAVRAGAMACALIPLSVTLASPLGSRAVIDGVDGSTVEVGVAPAQNTG